MEAIFDNRFIDANIEEYKEIEKELGILKAIMEKDKAAAKAGAAAPAAPAAAEPDSDGGGDAAAAITAGAAPPSGLDGASASDAAGAAESTAGAEPSPRRPRFTRGLNGQATPVVACGLHSQVRH
mmetsp:Transcript_19657/g.42847  ORF Transcript_19657/g.42847 Transcript_19657/m.42847 type:complete len:125 (+) Transcript_19657:597-971(+)